jgi:aerobic C4-dicarboxylate transport protein
MSMARAITNTIGNAVAAVIVAKWDGAFDQTAWAEATANLSIAKQDQWTSTQTICRS